ncbi:MAG: sigma 54-interacting transcriptional regulator [Acidobacteria bacterium]|nr:sigma 54-interacting transcriptional regulator [Acidobacteriota bacterium]
MHARGSSTGVEPAAGRRRNRRILIVDDQAELHDDLAEMLVPTTEERASDELSAAFAGPGAEPDSAPSDAAAQPDFELSHAFTGREACERVEGAHRAGKPFAMAFVDVRMPPGMDGIEAVQRIRDTDRDIEIVIMTAYSDRTLADIARGNDLLHKMLYVRKPFTREEIQQIAACLVGKWNVERALKTRAREIAAGKRTLEAVLDATGDAMVMFDEAGRFVLANREFERVCSVGREELRVMSGTELGDRFGEPRAVGVEAGFAVEGTGVLVEQKRENGSGRLFHRSKTPVKDGRGTVMGRLEVYRDVAKDIEIQRMKGEVTRLRGELEAAHSFGEMVGRSRKMRELYGFIRQGAASDASVLIRGETGTGKELVARAFHRNSPRRHGPFVSVSCAAIPESLVESELFGHERGAFTDARETRRGAFERAEGGTLFLDEIGDMHVSAQAKLLRVLEEREFQRLGGSGTRKADVRVLAATHRDLRRDVEAGGIREDLYHRLSVFPVTVPPLRQRREDIPLLANHFLAKQSERAGKSVDGVSAAAMRMLLQYDWPGNVRELANVLERAVLLETGSVIQAGSLPRRLSEAVGSATGADRGAVPAVRTLAAIEREALADALALSGNNVTEAARGLGIDRSTFYRKLERHGLRPRG